jgi:DNA-binding NtrC family response regulator
MRGGTPQVPGPDPERDVETASDKRPRVLILDDDPVVLLLLEEICAEYGWSAIGVVSSADAFLAAGLQRVDLILIDLNLKEGSALRLLPEMRTICPGTPVVVVTGQSPEEVAAAVIAAGAHGVIGKPCSVSQVAELLGRYRPLHIG